jgi:hypothetical protein
MNPLLFFLFQERDLQCSVWSAVGYVTIKEFCKVKNLIWVKEVTNMPHQHPLEMEALVNARL